ncbi:OXA-48 family carbapenem-hydrolyzing class D beta-lactamase OXA-54 [Spirosoma humi]
MKSLAFLSILVLLAAYQPPSVTDRPDLGRFFDAEKLPGSFLLYDLKKDAYTAYRFERCQQTFLPASTFKIANTLIGLETGILQNENTPMKWDGVKRDVAAWNQDHTLQSAFQVSCVPCYRELARQIGLERMTAFVKKAHYGHMDIHADNLDQFWLTGKSRISQVEEIDFLKRIYQGNVPFSERNRAVLKKIMLMDEKPTYKLYGKTGWATNIDGTTVTGPNIGWFVGYVEKGNDVYFFATNVEHPTPVPDTFVPGRRRITEKILAELGIL